MAFGRLGSGFDGYVAGRVDMSDSGKRDTSRSEGFVVCGRDCRGMDDEVARAMFIMMYVETCKRSVIAAS